MHPTRARSGPATPVLLAAVAAVLAALLATALSAPAQAAPDRKPEHHAKFDVKRLDATDYQFFGTVFTYPQGTLVVLRKRDGSARFQSWKKVKLHNDGSFSTRLSGGRGDCFRMRIPKTDGYRTTTADLGCIVAR